MYIRLFGKTYKARQEFFSPAKSILMEFLDNVKKHAVKHDCGEFYTAVIIMMYVTSAAILRELSVKDLSQVYDGKFMQKVDESKKADVTDGYS